MYGAVYSGCPSCLLLQIKKELTSEYLSMRVTSCDSNFNATRLPRLRRGKGRRGAGEGRRAGGGEWKEGGRGGGGGWVRVSELTPKTAGSVASAD